MSKQVVLRSEKDTERLAEEIAASLKKGDVIALYGPLGAGKTYFTKKLCKYLGVREMVSSPSYVLMNQYEGKFPVVHLDLYRLEWEEELLELGLFDLFDEGITIIEWAEVAANILPDRAKKIRFEFAGSNRIVQMD